MKPEKPFASSSSNILEAAQKGDWPKVNVLLRGNPSLIFSKADDGRTPLHNAAANGHKDVVELLLSSKATVNAKDNNGRTPLHHCAGDTAAAKDRKDVAELLLARKAEVSAKDKDGYMPLHFAAGSGYSDVAALLLAKRAEVNAEANDGTTPLHLAAMNDHKDVAELLLEKGAEVNAKSDAGLTPLCGAAWKGYKDVAALLLANGAEVNAKNDEGTTPLQLAASLGYKDVAALLLTKGAEVNAKINDGTTPLHHAALKGFKDVAELLLANGAEVNAKEDSHGATPLHHAAGYGHKEVAALLLANGADVNARSNNGQTPLHHAALKGFKDVAELLLEKGAEVNAKDDRHGATPFHYAAGSGYNDVAALLLAKGADVNARSNNGQTPLQLAAVKGHKEVAALLLANGADVNPKTHNAAHQSEQPIAPESIYTQLSQTLQKPVDEILSFLEMKIEVGALATDSIVVDFLAAANGFTERCCSSCADLLRHSSRLPEVRATPTVTLANQIRAEVFPKCDAILEQCRQHLQAEVTAIARIPSQEPGLISTALQGAATGQLAAGLGKHGKTLGTVGAMLAVGEQWSRRTALLATQLEAAEQAQASARGKISEYLGAMIPGLCQDLFDYGCAKCLGAEIDFKSQEAALDKLGDFIRDHQAKLDRALKGDADRRREKEEGALKAASAERAEQQKSVEEATGRSLKRCGWYLVGLAVFFIATAFGAMQDSTSVVAGACLFTFGAVMLAAGIRLSWGKKKPQQAGERLKSPIASADSQWPNVGSIAQRGPREVQLPQPPEGWICGEYKGGSFFSNGHIVVKGEPPPGHRLSSQFLPGDLFASFQISPESERPVSADAFSIDSEGVEVIWFTNGTRIAAHYYDFLLSHHPEAQFLSAGRESPLKAIDRSGNMVGEVMPLKKVKPPLAVKELLRQVGEGAVPAAPASAQTKVCAYCGRENPLDTAQCRECGTTDFKPVEQQSTARQG